MLKRNWKILSAGMLGLAMWLVLTPKPIIPIIPTLPIILAVVLGMLVTA